MRFGHDKEYYRINYRWCYYFPYLTSNRIKTESIRNLSNFSFQWTKTLYQNHIVNNITFFLHFSRAIDTILVTCNNTKDYFSWAPEKIKVKFCKNCKNPGNILEISCARCHFVKFDMYFLGLL